MVIFNFEYNVSMIMLRIFPFFQGIFALIIVFIFIISRIIFIYIFIKIFALYNDFYHICTYVLHIVSWGDLVPEQQINFTLLYFLSLSLFKWLFSFLPFLSSSPLLLFLLLLSTLICRVSWFYNCVPSHAGHPRNSYWNGPKHFYRYFILHESR